MIINPYKRIRDLEQRLADTEADIAMMQDQFYNVERIAYGRAEERFRERTRMLELSHRNLLEHLSRVAFNDHIII